MTLQPLLMSDDPAEQDEMAVYFLLRRRLLHGVIFGQSRLISSTSVLRRAGIKLLDEVARPWPVTNSPEKTRC